jgi:hypothetical protein
MYVAICYRMVGPLAVDVGLRLGNDILKPVVYLLGEKYLRTHMAVVSRSVVVGERRIGCPVAQRVSHPLGLSLEKYIVDGTAHPHRALNLARNSLEGHLARLVQPVGR